jgi:hypothetical protein
MARGRARKKSRQGSRSSNNIAGGQVVRVKGNAILATPDNAAVGTFVETDYRLDTDLCAVWQQYSQLYQKWRILHLRFQHTPTHGTDTGGNVVMYINEDPDAPSAPTSFVQAMNNRVAKAGPLWKPISLSYRPHQAMRWLYTANVFSSDDRLECTGILYYCTANINALTGTLFPGYITMHFDVEFTDMCNSTTAIARGPRGPKPPPSDSKDDKDGKKAEADKLTKQIAAMTARLQQLA